MAEKQSESYKQNIFAMDSEQINEQPLDLSKKTSDSESSATKCDSGIQNPRDSTSDGLPLVYETKPYMLSHPFTAARVAVAYNSLLFEPTPSLPVVPVGKSFPITNIGETLPFTFPVSLPMTGLNRSPLMGTSQPQNAKEGRKRKVANRIVPATTLGTTPTLPHTSVNESNSSSNVDSLPSYQQIGSSDVKVNHDKYWELKRRKNEKQKEYRAIRQAKKESIVRRVAFVEEENKRLNSELSVLKAENAAFQNLFFQRRSSSD